MSICLEVSSTESAALPSDADIAVLGADAVLGEWDPARAVRLSPAEGSAHWSGEVAIPAVGSEFKLVMFQGSEISWEPLEENRRFPSGVGSGFTLKMGFGDRRIGVEVSAHHIEANAKATRKMVDRQGSALQEDLDRKGDNAYYHAHNRDFEVPPDAKVISGPGLITGGAPTLLEVGASGLDTREEDRTVWLKDYSWADSTGKVKVYVPLPDGVLPAEGADSIVEAAWAPHQVDLIISSKPRRVLKIEKLNAEIKTDACTVRVEPQKKRVVLQLAKKRETTWYSLTKGK